MMASSIDHCSSTLTRPTRLPSRSTEMALICSSKTRVDCFCTLISGRIDAGCAFFDVGAITTTDLGNNESDCKMTAKRGPCCSCFVPLWMVMAKMSPRFMIDETRTLSQSRNDSINWATRCISSRSSGFASRAAISAASLCGLASAAADSINAYRIASDWLIPVACNLRNARLDARSSRKERASAISLNVSRIVILIMGCWFRGEPGGAAN